MNENIDRPVWAVKEESKFTTSSNGKLTYNGLRISQLVEYIDNAQSSLPNHAIDTYDELATVAEFLKSLEG